MTSSGLQGPDTDTAPRADASSCAGAARALACINDVACEIFRAGLALDALQQAAESEYGKCRAAAASEALDRAVAELRALAVLISDEAGDSVRDVVEESPQ